MMKVVKKAVLPLGFKASGVHAGLKKSGKLDVSLIYSSVPAKVAAKFTTNKIVAAPLILAKRNLKTNRQVQAILVNSGNANCFTGAAGIIDAQQSALALGKSLGIKKESVVVSSTGVIGKRLPVDKIKRAIPGLVAGLSAKGIDDAKLGILTTDTFAKEISVKCNLGKQTVTICGIAKGAGMIAPNMATMLCFILTDANISQKALNQALVDCVDKTFNCITVDGCMSTNDSVILLANGRAKNSLIESGKNYHAFAQALHIVCLELAKMVVQDGEGATKFIEIIITRAKDTKEARTAALAIANSNLFKTAMYGENPNFGRIAASVGASGVDVKESDLKFKVSSLKQRNIFVEVSLNRGKASATVYTSDLTPEYVKINAEYN